MKKLALAGMMGASAIFGAKETMAATIPWGPNTPNAEIFYDWESPENYASGSVNITDTRTGQGIPSDLAWSLIYVANLPEGRAAIGQIKGVGNNATGSFGVPPGVDLNSILANNNGQHISGINLNRDPIYGSFNDVDLLFNPQTGEYFNNINVTYDTSSHTFSIIADYTSASEPSTSALLALGLSAVEGGTNNIKLAVAVSNAATFSITYKNSLTNATWESLGTYSKTSAVTVITDTNNVPQRFYRVVTP